MKRTTVRLDDGLFAQAKSFAARRNTTLTAVIEESLRETLSRQKPSRRVKAIRLITVRGHGPCPGIDLDDTAALLEAMEAPRGPH